MSLDNVHVILVLDSLKEKKKEKEKKYKLFKLNNTVQYFRFLCKAREAQKNLKK